MRASVALALCAPLTVMLAGCTAPLTKSAITSNTVQEQTHNSYLLLNIARARERMPMHFTQLDAVRAGPGGIAFAGSSLAFDLVEGSAANTLKPALALNSGVDTASLVSQDFTRGITTPVDATLLAYFAAQGWPISLLLHLFVGSIQVVNEKGRITGSLDNAPSAPTFEAFQALVTDLEKCRLSLSEYKSYQFHGNPLLKTELKDLKDVVEARKAGLELVPVARDGTRTETEADGYVHIRLAAVSSVPRLQFHQRSIEAPACPVARPAGAGFMAGASEETQAQVQAVFDEFTKEAPRGYSSQGGEKAQRQGKRRASILSCVRRSR